MATPGPSAGDPRPPFPPPRADLVSGSGKPNDGSPVLAGILAGVLSAVVWAALVYLTHNTIGLAAWGVGGLVGIAVAQPVREPRGASRASVAVVLTAAAIIFAKVLIVEVALPPVIRDEILRSPEATAAAYMVDMAAHRSFSPTLQAALDSVARERHDTAGSEDWGLRYRMITEARQRAGAAAPDDRERVVRAAMGGIFARLGFLPLLGRSFGVWDLLWFGFAISSAWKLAQSPTG
jgi:hypothetical protein